MKENMKGLARFFAWCGGAVIRLLELPQCSIVRDRYAAYGVSVLVATAFSGVSGYLYAVAIFGLRPLLGFVAGLAWGLIIFTIDRMMLSSLVFLEGDTKKDRALKVLPRAILTLVIGITVIDPVALWLNRKDLDLQIEKDNQTELEGIEKRVGMRQSAARGRLDSLEKVIRSDLKGRDSLVREAFLVIDKEARGELGTGEGEGIHYRRNKANYDRLLADRNSLRLWSVPELERIGAQRAVLDSQLRTEVNAVVKKAEITDGLIRRNQAFVNLIKDEKGGWGILFSIVLMFFTLVAIESYPTWSKATSRRSPYDAAYQHEFDGAIAQFDHQRIATQVELANEKIFRESAFKRAQAALAQVAQDAFSEDELGPVRQKILHLVQVLLGRVGGPLGQRVDKEGDPAPKAANASESASAGTKGSDSSESEFEASPSVKTDRNQGDIADDSAPVQDAPTAVKPSEISPTRPGVFRRGIGVLAGGCKRAWGHSLFRRTTQAMVLFMSLGLAGAGALGYITREAWMRPCGASPCPYEQWVIDAEMQTRVLDAAGRTIGSFPEYPLVQVEDLPEYVVPLLTATEDKNFFAHFGVDPWAVAKSAINNCLGRARRGGSGITMQLAKTLDIGKAMPRGGIQGKAAQARVAIDLNRRLTKDKQLFLYLNKVDLGWVNGDSVRGVNHAAYQYFGKSAKNLSLAEWATLIGMIRGPMLYQPTRRPDLAKKRRDWTLARLAKEFPAYANMAREAGEQPLDVASPNQVVKTSPLMNLVKNSVGRDFRPSVLTTSIDSGMQHWIEGEQSALLGDIMGGRFGAYVPDSNKLVVGMILTEATSGKLLGYTCGGPGVKWDPCVRGKVPLNSTLKIFLVAQGLESGVIRKDDRLKDILNRIHAQKASYMREVCESSRARMEHSLGDLVAVSDNCLAIAIHGLLRPADFEQLRGLGVDIDPAKPATALGSGVLSPFLLHDLISAFANGGSARSWSVAEIDGASHEVRLPYRSSTITAVKEIFSPVLAEGGTGALAKAHLPSGASAFAKTGTADGRSSLLMTGAANNHVLTLWVGHIPSSRPISDAATAGHVLAPTWGRLIATAQNVSSQEASPYTRRSSPVLQDHAKDPQEVVHHRSLAMSAGQVP